MLTICYAGKSQITRSKQPILGSDLKRAGATEIAQTYFGMRKKGNNRKRENRIKYNKINPHFLLYSNLCLTGRLVDSAQCPSASRQIFLNNVNEYKVN